MIEMNALFERFVEWLVDRALSGSAATVQRQRRDATVIRSPRTRRVLIPDVLITVDGHDIPVDAKYRRYDGRDVSNSDIYQLLIYAQAYGNESRIPTSVLVYPHEQAVTSTSAFGLVTDGRTRAVVRCIGIPPPHILKGLSVGLTDAVDETCASLRRAFGVGSEAEEIAWSVGVGEAV